MNQFSKQYLLLFRTLPDTGAAVPQTLGPARAAHWSPADSAQHASWSASRC